MAVTRDDVKRANAQYRRASKRGGYAATRARRQIERAVIAILEGK